MDRRRVEWTSTILRTRCSWGKRLTVRHPLRGLLSDVSCLSHRDTVVAVTVQALACLLILLLLSATAFQKQSYYSCYSQYRGNHTCSNASFLRSR